MGVAARTLESRSEAAPQPAERSSLIAPAASGSGPGRAAASSCGATATAPDMPLRQTSARIQPACKDDSHRDPGAARQWSWRPQPKQARHPQGTRFRRRDSRSPSRASRTSPTVHSRLRANEPLPHERVQPVAQHRQEAHREWERDRPCHAANAQRHARRAARRLAYSTQRDASAVVCSMQRERNPTSRHATCTVRWRKTYCSPEDCAKGYG